MVASGLGGMTPTGAAIISCAHSIDPTYREAFHCCLLEMCSELQPLQQELHHFLSIQGSLI